MGMFYVLTCFGLNGSDVGGGLSAGSAVCIDEECYALFYYFTP